MVFIIKLYEKRFVRDLNNRILGGVASGIGNYFGVNPKYIRVVFLVATLFPPFFPSFILYCVLWLLIPESKIKKTKKNKKGEVVIDVEVD
ncbi:PspC domain-containing protein [Candidatus Gracilibacteria bacterium]|nr:PspC domain-containing protein [Candidatus Gracilibacteria bacterium]